MTTEVALKCACDSVRGTATALDPRTGNRLVCMCDDCQAYAHYLDRADVMLDENGGTDIFQITPAQVRITAGHEHLRCVRLSDRGLMRWYAGCCNTPVANTLASARVPFAGVVQPFMDHAGDGRPRDEVLGPILSRAFATYGKGPLPSDAHPKAPLSVILRAIRLLARGWLRRKHKPSPFFDADTGKPVVEPIVLDSAAREALRARSAC